MGRILAIDYGNKRVGLAVSDPLKIIASGLTTIPAHTTLAFIVDYVEKNEVDTIVVGLPKQLNNEFSESYKYIKPFVDKLKKTLPTYKIIYVDERFTSTLANRAIIEGGVRKSERRNNKGLVDMVSATIILQSYMESREYNG